MFALCRPYNLFSGKSRPKRVFTLSSFVSCVAFCVLGVYWMYFGLFGSLSTSCRVCVHVVCCDFLVWFFVCRNLFVFRMFVMLNGVFWLYNCVICRGVATSCVRGLLRIPLL